MPNTTTKLKDSFLIGYELIKYIRNTLNVKNHIVVLTVVVNEELLNPIREIVNEVLIKPITPSSFKKTIQNIFRGK